MHVDRLELVGAQQRHQRAGLDFGPAITVEAIAIPSPAITLANAPGPELV